MQSRKGEELLDLSADHLLREAFLIMYATLQ